MAGEPVPQRGAFTVCFTDKNDVLSQCHVTPQIQYCDFLVVLHDLTKPFAHKISGLPTSKEPGEGLSLKDGDWRYRILRPTPLKPPSEHDGKWQNASSGPIKEDWQILNCGVGFDLMIDRLTLGPKSVGSWIEVQHQWQAHRDENTAAGKLKSKGPLIVDGSQAPPEAHADQSNMLQIYPSQIQLSRIGASIASEPENPILDPIWYKQPMELWNGQQHPLFSRSTQVQGISQPGVQDNLFSRSEDEQISGSRIPIEQIRKNTAKRVRLGTAPKPGLFQPPKPRQHHNPYKNSSRANFSQTRQPRGAGTHGYGSSQPSNGSKVYNNGPFRPESSMVPLYFYGPGGLQFQVVDGFVSNVVGSARDMQTNWQSYRHVSDVSNPYSDDPPIDPALLEADASRRLIGANQETPVSIPNTPLTPQASSCDVAQSQQLNFSNSNETMYQQPDLAQESKPSYLDPALEANHKRGAFPSMPYFPHGRRGGQSKGPVAGYAFNAWSPSPASMTTNGVEAYYHHPNRRATFQRRAWTTSGGPNSESEMKHSRKGMPNSSHVAESVNTKNEKVQDLEQTNTVHEAQAKKNNSKKAGKKKPKQNKKTTSENPEQAPEGQVLQDESKEARDQRAARRESLKTQL